MSHKTPPNPVWFLVVVLFLSVLIWLGPIEEWPFWERSCIEQELDEIDYEFKWLDEEEIVISNN